MQPPVPPDDPLELAALAREVVARANFPMLGTCGADGAPRVRPISPLRVDNFTVTFANLRRYGKTAELAENPRLELCYLDDRHWQTRITARAVEITDAAERQAIWDASPLLRKFMGSVDNPELILYRAEPERVRFMQEWALDYSEIDWRLKA